MTTISMLHIDDGHFLSSAISSSLQIRLVHLDTKNCACAMSVVLTCPFLILTVDWRTISEAK